MPALDGLRAVAVAAVLLYHGDVAWARGGYLGVDAFFVLSSFLGARAFLILPRLTRGSRAALLGSRAERFSPGGSRGRR